MLNLFGFFVCFLERRLFFRHWLFLVLMKLKDNERWTESGKLRANIILDLKNKTQTNKIKIADIE